MELKWVCLVACTLVGLSNSAFVDTLKKCPYEDDNCVAALFKNIFSELGEKGAPEINIPPIDPLVLTNTKIDIPSFFNAIVEEGQVRGVQDCVFNSIHNDFEKGATNVDLTCDLTATAKFKLYDISPMVKSLFGQDSDHGYGDINLKLEKVHLKITFFYHFVKKNDGDIYLKGHVDEFKSEFDVGNVIVKVNKLVLGQHDISEIVEIFFNQNWKTILPIFGKAILDTGMNILSNILLTLNDKIPAKKLYSNDLTSFVKN